MTALPKRSESCGAHMPLRAIAIAACAVALATSFVAAEVSELSIDSGGRPLAVTRYAAAGAAARPGVMVLHGASGLDVGREAYAQYARLLAANGIDAYLLDYFGPRATWICGCWSALIGNERRGPAVAAPRLR